MKKDTTVSEESKQDLAIEKIEPAVDQQEKLDTVIPEQENSAPASFSKVAFPFVDNAYVDEALLFFNRNGYKTEIETHMDDAGTRIVKWLLIEIAAPKVAQN